MTDADARGNLWRRTDKAIITKLKRRCRIEQVKSVVFRTRNAKCSAKPPWSAGEFRRSRICCQAAIGSHHVLAKHRLQSANQDGPSLALRLAGHIHAVIHAVDEVDVGM